MGPSAARVQGQLVDCKGCGKDSHGKSKERGVSRAYINVRECAAVGKQLRWRWQRKYVFVSKRARRRLETAQGRCVHRVQPECDLLGDLRSPCRVLSRSPTARPTAHPIQPSTASHTQTDRPLCNVPRTVARTPTRERSSCASDAVRREYPRPTSLEWCGYLLNPASARRQRARAGGSWRKAPCLAWHLGHQRTRTSPPRRST